jgi:hypothetical protein
MPPSPAPTVPDLAERTVDRTYGRVVSMLKIRGRRTNTWHTMLGRALNKLRGQEPLDLEVQLETCAICASDFVNPVDWEPVGDTHWWMLLRCGACDTWREVTVTNAIATRYDFELDKRLDILTRALERIDKKRMAAEVETMIEALRRGLVDAADFAR